MRRGWFFVTIAIAASAGAQTPPPKLWSQFTTTSPHASVASAACALGANAVLDGRSMPIALDAFDDASQICASAQSAPTAVHGRVKMTTAQPGVVVVELDVPPGGSERATSDLRVVLQNMTADLARRTAPAAPQGPPPMSFGAEGAECRRDRDCAGVPCVEHVCTASFHETKVPNTPLVVGGFATAGAGYFVQLLVAVAIASSAGDPGTSRAWPFIPIIGLEAFSGSYKEAANCDCDAGRAFAVIGSVLVSLIEVAGIVIGVAGVSTPRTKLMRGKVSLRFGPTGLAGSF
ncbi:MAG TPA: hypothetical protein VGH28_24640 [Polyangiaceae bacterium]|jgi:hypothetical protein